MAGEYENGTPLADRAKALVYPLALNQSLLQRYLRDRVPVGDPRGPLVVEALIVLNRCEKAARALYVPSYEGL